MNLIKTVYKMKKFVFSIAMIAVAIHGFSQNTDKGKKIYSQVCIACHQPTGLGIPGAFPPLAKSDYLNKDVNRAIKGVVKGLKGTIIVNGKTYNGVMPSQALSDQQIAGAFTYVYANWGNNKTVVNGAMVLKQRK
ncbi:Cytochrome C oxidase, cbb3-type, subunit III [Flavobacterium micromati]|uniref:Cytochrome C oxidase, cbb3-type, subunit III n=2 Tax=Flavobacterium micromati TaxID=229205 RepID=A0A1M5PJZ8_9FLAO|nr:Cytochrome C oxidase, cbb3-type, subunit III [Flavobacterium micromati]